MPTDDTPTAADTMCMDIDHYASADDTPDGGLLPCPFCGCAAHLTGAGPGRRGDMDAYVVCPGCQAEGPLRCAYAGDDYDACQSAAVEAWNTRRPPPDPLRAAQEDGNE